MITFMQQVLNGLVSGASYALFAVGMALVFGVNRILNLAHGAVFMFGALIGYYAATTFEMPFWASLIAGMVGAGILTVILDMIAFRGLERGRGSGEAPIVTSLGAILVLQTIAERLTNATSVSFPNGSLPSSPITVGGISISPGGGIILLCGIFLGVALWMALTRTGWGAQVRAVSVNESTSSLLGINVSLIRGEVFFLSGCLAGLAGVLIATTYNSITYNMGDNYLLIGFAVLVVGGLDSLGGALLASGIVGIATSLTAQYWTSAFSDAVPFVLLIAILAIKPTGLFGGVFEERRVARR